MDRFVGTHENRLDAKGRVSVPARFRELLRAGSEPHAPVRLMLRPSHKLDCIECWPAAGFERLAGTLNALDPLGDEYDRRSAMIYGRTTEVELDKEGRIVLGPKLTARARVTDRVAFMGMGELFQIWDPDTVERYQAESEAAFRTGRPS